MNDILILIFFVMFLLLKYYVSKDAFDLQYYLNSFFISLLVLAAEYGNVELLKISIVVVFWGLLFSFFVNKKWRSHG